MYIPIVHHICDEAAGYWIRDQVRHVELDYSRSGHHIVFKKTQNKTKQHKSREESLITNRVTDKTNAYMVTQSLDVYTHYNTQQSSKEVRKQGNETCVFV